MVAVGDRGLDVGQRRVVAVALIGRVVVAHAAARGPAARDRSARGRGVRVHEVARVTSQTALVLAGAVGDAVDGPAQVRRVVDEVLARRESVVTRRGRVTAAARLDGGHNTGLVAALERTGGAVDSLEVRGGVATRVRAVSGSRIAGRVELGSLVGGGVGAMALERRVAHVARLFGVVAAAAHSVEAVDAAGVGVAALGCAARSAVQRAHVERVVAAGAQTGARLGRAVLCQLKPLVRQSPAGRAPLGSRRCRGTWCTQPRWSSRSTSS